MLIKSKNTYLSIGVLGIIASLICRVALLLIGRINNSFMLYSIDFLFVFSECLLLVLVLFSNNKILCAAPVQYGLQISISNIFMWIYCIGDCWCLYVPLQKTLSHVVAFYYDCCFCSSCSDFAFNYYWCSIRWDTKPIIWIR